MSKEQALELLDQMRNAAIRLRLHYASTLPVEKQRDLNAVLHDAQDLVQDAQQLIDPR